VVEHFREHTRSKIGGKAKAMVVRSSRLHAARYRARDRPLTSTRRGNTDVDALVALSGTVIDQGDEFTEPRMNEFPESQTARGFAEGDYQVLVAAEKFQTGYDQPLLHMMFVDKPLIGLHARDLACQLHDLVSLAAPARGHDEQKNRPRGETDDTQDDTRCCISPSFSPRTTVNLTLGLNAKDDGQNGKDDRQHDDPPITRAPARTDW
jgi:hypothetical protein